MTPTINRGHSSSSTDKGKPEYCTVFANLETLKLEPGNIDQALKLFKQQYGQDRDPAALGILNSKQNKTIIAEVQRRGYTVIHFPKGMLSFEIWLYPHTPTMHQSLQSDIGTEGRILATKNLAPIPSCQKPEGVSQHRFRDLSPSLTASEHRRKPKGRPRIDVPMARIRRLGRQGLRAKAIASRLKAEGRSISYRTVHRILSGER
jgi:hypothetical protein